MNTFDVIEIKIKVDFLTYFSNLYITVININTCRLIFV